jgi:HSP20 family protein
MATRYPVSTLAGDMISLRSAMDRLLNESFIPGQMRSFWSDQANGSSRTMLPLDVYATDDAFVVLAAIPGINPDELQITIDKNTLTLSGEVANVADAENTKGATWYVHELQHGSFERSVTLPATLDASRADATFENGMFRLTLPKAESEKPKQIKVKVGSVSGGTPSISEGTTAAE